MRLSLKERTRLSEWTGRKGHQAMRVAAAALALLLLGCRQDPPAPGKEVSFALSPEAQEFMELGKVFLQAVDSCWAVSQERNWQETERIIVGTIHSASRFWGADQEKWEEVFLLVCSETWCRNVDNPRDPSYGAGQVTIEAFHAMAKHYPKIIQLPAGRRAQVRYLQENIEGNLDVTAAEMKYCERFYPARQQTNRVCCYKLGRLGKFNGRSGKVRKENFWLLRRQYRCVRKFWKERGGRDLCPCIWNPRRAVKR